MGFYNDLRFGQDSERLLVEKYDCLEHTSCRKSDFKIKHTNILCELKSDSYDMNKYGNIIIERFSKEEKPGGPYQSRANGCRYFIYMFVQNQKIFVFDVVRLIARVNKLAKKRGLKLHERWNPGYTTRYYKIPIVDLLDLDVGMEKLENEYKKAKVKHEKSNRLKSGSVKITK